MKMSKMLVGTIFILLIFSMSLSAIFIDNYFDELMKSNLMGKYFLQALGFSLPTILLAVFFIRKK